MTKPALATARLSTIRLRHPVRNEAAHVVDLDAWADAARLIAQQRRRVEVVHRVGQGALAIEVPSDREPVVRALSVLHDPATGACVRAERAASRALGGSCQVPLAAHAVVHRRSSPVP